MRPRKCRDCHQSGHNRATCPRGSRAADRLPSAPPGNLLRMLIDPAQALALVTEGQVGAALANATRRIGELRGDGLGHLVRDDILVALAELELRARTLPADAVTAIQSTMEVIETARRALKDAERAHARARAAVLVGLGYREKVEELDSRVVEDNHGVRP